MASCYVNGHGTSGSRLSKQWPTTSKLPLQLRQGVTSRSTSNGRMWFNAFVNLPMAAALRSRLRLRLRLRATVSAGKVSRRRSTASTTAVTWSTSGKPPGACRRSSYHVLQRAPVLFLDPSSSITSEKQPSARRWQPTFFAGWKKAGSGSGRHARFLWRTQRKVIE